MLCLSSGTTGAPKAVVQASLVALMVSGFWVPLEERE
jgi:acyl-CoA synthetase (AMP-forming)/AMP-acid ligase II